VKRNLRKGKRGRLHSSTKRVSKREIASRRAGHVKGKIGRRENTTMGPLSIPYVEHPKKSRRKSKGVAEKKEEKGGQDISSEEGSTIEYNGIFPKSIITQMEDEMDHSNAPIRNIPGQKQKPKKPLKVLQWKRTDLIKVARVGREFQKKMGWEDFFHKKRVPGSANKTTLWESIPPTVQQLLDILEISEKVLNEKKKIIESLAMSRNIIVSYLWEDYNPEWHQDVERTFDALKFNSSHISLDSAFVGLRRLGCEISEKIHARIRLRLDDSSGKDKKDTKTIRKAEVTSSFKSANIVQTGPLAFDFKGYRLLAGLGQEGVFRQIVSQKEIMKWSERKKNEIQHREAHIRSIQDKHLAKCDWPKERRLDYKRKNEKLVNFFTALGVGKKTLGRINERRKGRCKSLTNVQDAMTELAGFSNFTKGYERTFKMHFCRAHSKIEPDFKLAVFRELQWFTSKGYVTPKINASESDYFRPSAIQELELLFTGSKLNSHPDTSSSKSLKSLEFATLPARQKRDKVPSQSPWESNRGSQKRTKLLQEFDSLLS